VKSWRKGGFVYTCPDHEKTNLLIVLENNMRKSRKSYELFLNLLRKILKPFDLPSIPKLNEKK